ncbi:class I SAM-dependent methyltransferase [Spiribacter halobius]|uniref:Class I SAM-dependent methyltransferase n=1 Tax=Sediminicurvatus halobius TaxID=2182432 RepID=A0A2U2N9H9_9GAMM|nr:class I SAM-dependent methyltransferase [Spiribacter halobius]PWG65841.1 class I SAM-dependent methyltransferase [Spiribacter halobius]UEX77885.1 class I SAM-dependent methyltransferase [Spiribacter halobius]
MSTAPSPRATAAVERYYRRHAGIYDLTRWSFLFGRRGIIEALPADLHPASILEVGCGTGVNLVRLGRRFPTARITGLDASARMLGRAARRLARLDVRPRLLHRPYLRPEGPSGGFDLILFSYALSMFNPGRDDALDHALEDLAPRGLVAVVDFEHSASPLFRRWMRLNHVRMEGDLRPALQQRFRPLLADSRPAYAGLWRYLMFLGGRP